MSDYTINTKKDGKTTKMEMDVSPELKDALLGKFNSTPFPKPLEPKVMFLDKTTRGELEDTDNLKKQIRARLEGYPIRYTKLLLKQLWLEIKDIPEIDYGGQYVAINAQVKEENLDS